MKKAKDTKTTGTMADYLIQKLKDEKKGLDNAIAYIRASFLSSAVDALFYARRSAGLTQEQIAQKLGKKQEAIARWEGDAEGKMSLRQYFDLAVACGKVPLNIVLEPIETVRDFVIDHPEEPQTPDLYYVWHNQRNQTPSIAQYNTAPITFTLNTAPITFTLEKGISGAPVMAMPNQVSEPRIIFVVEPKQTSQTLQERYPTGQAADEYLKCQRLLRQFDESATNRTSASQLSALALPLA